MEADVPRARIVVAWPVVPRYAAGSTERMHNIRRLHAELLQGYNQDAGTPDFADRENEPW